MLEKSASKAYTKLVPPALNTTALRSTCTWRYNTSAEDFDVCTHVTQRPLNSQKIGETKATMLNNPFNNEYHNLASKRKAFPVCFHAKNFLSVSEKRFAWWGDIFYARPHDRNSTCPSQHLSCTTSIFWVLDGQNKNLNTDHKLLPLFLHFWIKLRFHVNLLPYFTWKQLLSCLFINFPCAISPYNCGLCKPVHTKVHHSMSLIQRPSFL